MDTLVPKLLNYVDLMNAFLKEFNSLPKIRLEGDNYFNRHRFFNSLPRDSFSAYEKYFHFLEFLHTESLSNYLFFHKGTPYYWMGLCTFYFNDFQSSSFFIDASVSEDIASGKRIKSNTPGMLFLQANPDKPAQAGKRLVEYIEARIQSCINYYIDLTANIQIAHLTIDKIRHSFLKKNLLLKNRHMRSLSTTFLSFMLEWDYLNRLLNIVPHISSIEPFYMHLFKGCILLESLLKNNPIQRPVKTKLCNILQELKPILFLPHINGFGSIDLKEIIKDIKKSPKTLYDAFIFSGRIRNSVSHNIAWSVKLNSSQFQKLHFFISSACLHTINCLY
jgi:hypothetical protein